MSASILARREHGPRSALHDGLLRSVANAYGTRGRGGRASRGSYGLRSGRCRGRFCDGHPRLRRPFAPCRFARGASRQRVGRIQETCRRPRGPRFIYFRLRTYVNGGAWRWTSASTPAKQEQWRRPGVLPEATSVPAQSHSWSTPDSMPPGRKLASLALQRSAASAQRPA
jgi:hypothetical protein